MTATELPAVLAAFEDVPVDIHKEDAPTARGESIDESSSTKYEKNFWDLPIDKRVFIVVLFLVVSAVICSFVVISDVLLGMPSPWFDEDLPRSHHVDPNDTSEGQVGVERKTEHNVFSSVGWVLREEFRGHFFGWNVVDNIRLLSICALL